MHTSVPVVRRFSGQAGVSLVEMMVAVAIGLILISALTYSFAGTRAAFRAQEEQARKFENGRIAIDTIARDLRQASKMGCQRTNGTNAFVPKVILTATYPILESDEAGLISRGMLSQRDFFVAQREKGRRSLGSDQFVRGVDNATASDVPSGGTYAPLAGTDVIQILKASEASSHLTQDMTATQPNIFLVNKLPSWKPGTSGTSLFVVSDCLKTEIVRAQINVSAQGDGGKLDFDGGLNQGDGLLLKNYSTSAYVAKFEPAMYLVAQPSAASQVQTPVLVRYDIDDSGAQPGLWQNGGNIIADGIEDLQIRFGITSGDGRYVVDSYVAASGVTDWNNVITAEVSLTAISKGDRVGATTSTSASGATDQRLRQRFSTVVQLRNRPQQ